MPIAIGPACSAVGISCICTMGWPPAILHLFCSAGSIQHYLLLDRPLGPPWVWASIVPVFHQPWGQHPHQQHHERPADTATRRTSPSAKACIACMCPRVLPMTGLRRGRCVLGRHTLCPDYRGPFATFGDCARNHAASHPSLKGFPLTKAVPRCGLQGAFAHDWPVAPGSVQPATPPPQGLPSDGSRHQKGPSTDTAARMPQAPRALQAAEAASATPSRPYASLPRFPLSHPPSPPPSIQGRTRSATSCRHAHTCCLYRIPAAGTTKTTPCRDSHSAPDIWATGACCHMHCWPGC